MMVWSISGRARFSSSRKSTTGWLSVGNQYGGMNTVLPLFSSLFGKPIRSPGSDICPRNKVTTFWPLAEKWSVIILDLPMPCLPDSMMLCEGGVLSKRFLSSFVLMFMDI